MEVGVVDDSSYVSVELEDYFIDSSNSYWTILIIVLCWIILQRELAILFIAMKAFCHLLFDRLIFSFTTVSLWYNDSVLNHVYDKALSFFNCIKNSGL